MSGDKSEHVDINTDKVDIHTKNMTIIQKGPDDEQGRDPAREQPEEVDRSQQIKEKDVTRQQAPSTDGTHSPLAELSRREQAIPDPQAGAAADRRGIAEDHETVAERPTGAVAPGSPPAMNLSHGKIVEQDEARRLLDDNMVHANRTQAPPAMPGEQLEQRAGDAGIAPVDAAPSSPGTHQHTQYADAHLAAPGSVSGLRRETPLDGEDVTYAEDDARSGTRTVGSTGGRTFVEAPGSHAGVVVMGTGPARVVGVSRAGRSPSIAVPQRLAPSHTVQGSTPVDPVTADQDSTVLNASGGVLRDDTDATRTGLHGVRAVLPRAHRHQIADAGAAPDRADLPTDMALGQERALAVGAASPEDLAVANDLGLEASRDRDAARLQHDRDRAALRAERVAASEAASGPGVEPQTVQVLSAGMGLQIETPLHAPNRRAPMPGAALVDHDETKDQYATDDAGNEVFVGTSGTPAMPQFPEPLIRDWVHAPNLPADPLAPRFGVQHAVELPNDDGGF